MIKTMMFFGYFLVATNLFAQEMKVDLGLSLAPSIVPEVGYTKMRMRTGLELGFSLWNFSDEGVVKIKNIGEKTRPNMKFARFGLSYIENSYGLVFTPLAVNLQDRLYFAPSFTFGAKPYQTISISYEIK